MHGEGNGPAFWMSWICRNTDMTGESEGLCRLESVSTALTGDCEVGR